MTAWHPTTPAGLHGLTRDVMLARQAMHTAQIASRHHLPTQILRGQLVRDAVLRIGAGRSPTDAGRPAWLEVVLQLPGQHVQLIAAEALGRSRLEHDAARRRARAMVAGATVEVSCHALQLCLMDGDPALRATEPTIALWRPAGPIVMPAAAPASASAWAPTELADAAHQGLMP